MNTMNNREFEEFVLMQVRRSQAIYAVNRWIYLAMGLGGIVVFIIGISMHLNLAQGLSFLIMAVGFLPASIFSKKAAASYAEAADEMARVLEDLPDSYSNLQEDYSANTRMIHQSACKTLASTNSLIIAYGIIAVMCWVGGAVIVWASAPGTPSFIPGIFALSFVMFTIAAILTILTVKSIRDLPMSRRYARWLAEDAKSDESSDES